MIIAQLTGDLGNQMFQYALGRRLALIHRTELKLDIADFETSPHHYRLDRFRIRAAVAEKKDVSQLINLHLLRGADPKIAKELFAAQTNVKDNPYLVTLRDNTYLSGHCRTLSYFSTISGQLRRELKMKTAPEGLNKKYLRQIAKENSVALCLYHNEDGSAIPPARMDYLCRAVEYIANRLKHPTFYLFSDDPAWCKTNFIINYPIHYLSHNDPAAMAEDFRLMKRCKHAIIDHSALSWWGAWLNPRKDKIVIAPAAGYGCGSENDALLPHQWIRLTYGSLS